MVFIRLPRHSDFYIFNLIALEVYITIVFCIKSQKWKIQSVFKTAGISTIYTANAIKIKGKVGV